jgi:PAS domain S-box-containing protein
MQSPSQGGRVTDSVARCLAEAAQASEQAIVVGNRAGIVEWANAAWTRTTGFPLQETVAKPITHFLDEASIEVELVDFVAQHFLEGRSSTIEFPFDSFDGRSIWIHLEVQPIRNDQGELADFVAVATDITERRLNEEAAPSEPQHDEHEAVIASGHEHVEGALCEEAPPHPVDDSMTRLSLSGRIQIVCERLAPRPSARAQLDVCLDATLPPIHCDAALLDRTASLLLRAALFEADPSWSFVTVMTARTQVGRSFHSAAHPITARSPVLAEHPCLALEVHDTGPTLSPTDVEAIQSGRDGDSPRTQYLAEANRIAERLGGHLHLDSTPGCGTQALLFLPIR